MQITADLKYSSASMLSNSEHRMSFGNALNGWAITEGLQDVLNQQEVVKPPVWLL